MGGYKSCPPLRAWNRLEPRTRTYEFDRSLRTQIHDPLWYLTRQWQFGEFKGEDTGSPILAKVLVETTKIDGFKAHHGQRETYSDQYPLEMMVERIQLDLTYKERVQAGNYFLKTLQLAGQEYNASQPAKAFDKKAYKIKANDFYPLTLAALTNQSVEIQLQQAKIDINKKLQQYVQQFAGKVPDGGMIYTALKQNRTLFVRRFRLNTAHQRFILNAVNDFIDWFERMFPESKEVVSSWNTEKLEYQFTCTLPETNTDNTVLTADEYYTGKLDWYAFDVEEDPKNTNGMLTSATSQKKDLIKEHLFSFIPTPAVFAGMPSNRWWEFEDGNVDLGNINADTTDISKIVVVEFAAMYGNNWFMLPYQIPVGTLSEVKGILVTDVFGQQTLVESAIQGESDDWSGWGLYNLTKRKKDAYGSFEADTRLLLPPTLPKTQNSEPIEEVLFVKDETANLVWAIEYKVNSLMKSGMDAYNAAVEFSKYINELYAQDVDALDSHEAAKLKYILSNTVPENWIPFIAIHVGRDQRAVQLQRASMPRTIGNDHHPIRPRTQILRDGFTDEQADQVAPYVNPNADLQLSPYYLNEEEVPRAGIRVKGCLQRARWYNGKIVKWYAYRKTMGRGEGSSGLAFDQIQFLKNQPT